MSAEPRVAITRDDRGGVEVQLPRQVRRLIKSAAREVRNVISEGSADVAEWARLFPNAAVGDPSESRQLDDRIGATIRNRKAAAAKTTEASASKDRLSRDQAVAWMIDVNDARLVLSARIGSGEDILAESYQADPALTDIVNAYIALSIVLEQLVRAVDPS